VAHYEFEDNADDSSPNHLDGRLIGSAAIVTDADRGRVLGLDGTDGYVDCGRDSAFDITNAITVGAWVKITRIRMPYATIIAKGDSAWRLSAFQEQRKFHFAVTGAPFYHSADGGTTVPTNKWHHVCGTFDGSVIRLYVDGALDAIKSYNGKIGSNSFDVYIGENAEASGRPWDGSIDDLRIYNHALSDSEVADLAAAEQEEADPLWGRLANAGFAGDNIKATLFFPGQAKDGTSPYECSPGSNLSLYTVHPGDERHLKWAEASANRTFVIDQMVDVGLNVIAMSSWGEDFLPCSTAWTPWAPMQCSPQAHDELFAAAVGKHALIVPFIESRADWSFRNEFPKWGDEVAPGTVSQIVNFIQRYLQNSSHTEWADKWAQVYNRSGEPRYAVALIHASSEPLSAHDHAAFAAGFDTLAQEVFDKTHVKVGFLIDALPPDTYAPGKFRPSWQATGPFLKNQQSILGIMCFIPEIWIGSSDDAEVIAWKQDFSSGWASTGIPFLMDVSPGYDAHIVFPSSVRYGLSLDWMKALMQMVDECGDDGLVYNSWNGYTEGMAAMDLVEYGDVFYRWLGRMTCMYPERTCRDLYRCGKPLKGDVNKDCTVDLFDLAQLADNWLEQMQTRPTVTPINPPPVLR
jgi:hypothetical protein